MLSMQLRRLTVISALTALVTLFCSGADALRADEPQIVELTFMFRTDYEHFESLSMPYGDDAIGIVLDGTKPPESSKVWVNHTFAPFNVDGAYYLTDGRYIAKGGPTYASVWSTEPFLLPAHGFISLKRCVISEYTSGLASYYMTGVYGRDPEEGSVFLVFIRGWFEVQC